MYKSCVELEKLTEENHITSHMQTQFLSMILVDTIIMNSKYFQST